jgi:hypothetical protein
LPVGPWSNKKKNFSFDASRDLSEISKLIKVFLAPAKEGIRAWNEGCRKFLEKKRGSKDVFGPQREPINYFRQ